MNIIETDKNIRTKKPAHFSVVGIGASAGGLEAVTELLAYIPQQSGMAYLYIQHAPSEADSNMVEILKRVSKMPVLEASNNLEIEPDRLYVITHNAEVALEKDTIKISTRQKEQRHLPINYFFNSLAENYRERAIGILLSGNPPDGTLGLKAIKAEGGITFAQDHTAQFEGMAKNAISEAAVDLVLSPKRMGEELGKLVHHQDTYQAAIKQINEELIDDNDSSLTNILSQVHRLTGVNFSHYKLNTIKRRILRRMILQNIQSLQDYNQFLKHHTNEVNQLYQDLLINVTAFFRDRDMVNYLKKDLLPRILNIKGIAEPVRIWVPACSTGQEAYSLAILLMDVLGEKAATTSIQIFATDLSELAINKARLGIYSKDEVADIAPALLDRFFLKIDGSYRIIKSIRDLCVFASHNVIKDPPFSRLDIISCCNLLIYLEPPLQKKLMATFHYALNGTGYLILGQSETIGSSGSLFSQVDKKLKLYAKKKDAAANALFELSYRGGDQQRDPVYNGKRTSSKNKPEDLDLDKIVDQALLKKYTPACVVVNQDLDIVQFRGSTGLFLEPAPGKASLNLMKMARPGLGFELRNLVNKASKSGNMEGKTWTETMPGKNTMREVAIEAHPLRYDLESIERFFLVTFSEEDHPEIEASLKSISKDKKVLQLEGELKTLREDMRILIEEQEAANEELQSVNEEIVSSNEELQSINEELETSKEELESSNEELITINQELQMRNEQLVEVQEYSEAVFTTIREALLILDKNLRIKNANSRFYKTFRLTEEEVEGKILYELGNKQWNIPRLKELLEDVIPRNSQVSDFEIAHTFENIGEKVMLLSARRLVRRLHSEHLILVAIEDITEHRKAQRLVTEREEWFRNMADNAPIMIWVADTGKRLQFVNKAWLEYRGLQLREAIGQSWVEKMHTEDDNRVAKIFDDAFTRKIPFETQYRLRYGSDYKTIHSKGKPNFDHNHKFLGFIGSCVELPGETVK